MTVGLDVVSGKIISPTLESTRTESQFVAHIERTVATAPDKGWIFVVDNLNTHYSEGLVRFVAKACGIDEPLGKKKARGRAEERDKPAGVPVG